MQYNKQREELGHLQEKYGNSISAGAFRRGKVAQRSRRLLSNRSLEGALPASLLSLECFTDFIKAGYDVICAQAVQTAIPDDEETTSSSSSDEVRPAGEGFSFLAGRRPEDV